VTIHKQEGFSGFYRGLTPTLAQIIPSMGILFGTYESSKRVLVGLKVRTLMDIWQSMFLKKTDIGTAPTH
jgi:hypothetical protein